MGSFDLTCVLTGIGISPGTPVYSLALATSDLGSGPLTPILQAGTYDDYGRATGPRDARHFHAEAVVGALCAIPREGERDWKGLLEKEDPAPLLHGEGRVTTEFIRRDALDALVPEDLDLARLAHEKLSERFALYRDHDKVELFLDLVSEGACFQLRKAEPQGFWFGFCGTSILGARTLWNEVLTCVTNGGTPEDLVPLIRTAHATDFLVRMRVGWNPRSILHGEQSALDSMRAQAAFYQTCADICWQQADEDDAERAKWDLPLGE